MKARRSAASVSTARNTCGVGQIQSALRISPAPLRPASMRTSGCFRISSLREFAFFSLSRRTAEPPLYRIEKRPKLRNRQGQYSVVGIDGQILKRGHDLKTVLRVLERKLIRAVD